MYVYISSSLDLTIKATIQWLLPNADVTNFLMYFEQPKLALKFENLQTFLITGRSHATHVRVALMVVKPKRVENF